MSDNLEAKALEIAERRLLARGWKFNDEKIGEVAAEIINAMRSKLKNRK